MSAMGNFVMFAESVGDLVYNEKESQYVKAKNVKYSELLNRLEQLNLLIKKGEKNGNN